MNETIPPLPNADPQPKTSALAIWSLVLGILSLVLSWLCLSILAIPGVILGHMALSKIKQSACPLSGNSIAVAGLITGYIGIALMIFMVPMLANDTDNNSFQFRVSKIKDAVIANTNAKAIAIFQFLATLRKRVSLQRKDGLGDAGLNLGRKPFEFLAGIALDFNLPAHTWMVSSFNTRRKDWRG
jgi:hypothetical protein